MKRFTHTARRVTAGLLVLAPLALGACDIKQALLEPQQPSVIGPEDIENAGATGADALRIGALGRLQGWTAGGGNVNQENIVMFTDLLTDVWKSGDTFTQRNETDQRRIQTNNGTVASSYYTVSQSRFWYRDAITALRAATVTDKDSKIAEMYFALGYTELSMGEFFCNGIPLGETKDGVTTYTEPLTNNQVFDLAIIHLDSAISLAAGTTTLATTVKNAATSAKGRALVDLGRFTDAATTVAGVPTASQYTLTFAQTSQSNEIWTLNATQSSARYVVGDSFDLAGTLKNAIPFASARDPRVPTTGSSSDAAKPAIDRSTPWVGQQIWATREAPIVLASGIDARLMQAEAELRAGNIGNMMTILNALRTSAQRLGSFNVPAMAALPTPAAGVAAENLFFREKAFWQFARGMRLGDLRRLIRQYNRTEDQVFPTGRFFKGSSATYGTDVNLPVTDNEKTNPNFQGCLDRKA